MLKVLVVGLGSIGRRHVECLAQTGDVEVLALRTGKGTLKNCNGVAETFSVTEALAFGPDGVIVANPTSAHVDAALPFLRSGIRTLIEKPVASCSRQCDQLSPYESLVRVAYCMRFHPLNNLIKEVLETEKPYKLGFRRSHYLPKWHAYADYRTEYAAQKRLGGGVARTLSHEVDLMLHWFDKPDQVTGVLDKISDLEIDTDDYAFFTCRYKEGFRVNFELDFFSPSNVNCGELFTNKGKYSWDMRGLWFTAYSGSTPRLVQGFHDEMINEMYRLQMMDFLTFLDGRGSRNADFSSSVEVLKIIESLDA